MKRVIIAVTVLAVLVFAYTLNWEYAFNPDRANAQVGAVAPFRSSQVGTNPTDGDFLTTNGATSTWTDCATLLGAGLCDGSDDGGAGGGIADPFTHPAAGQSATTSLLLLNGNASTTMLSVGRTATTTLTTDGFVDIQGWRVSTSTTVCANGCEYTTYAAARTAGWKNIHFKEGIFTLTATSTIDADDIRITGEGEATVIRFPGSTVDSAFGVTNPLANKYQRIHISDMRIESSDVGSGIGIRLDGMKHSTFKNLHIVDTFGCLMADANQAFYNDIDNINCEPEGGSIGASNPETNNFMVKFINNANANTVSNSRYTVGSTGSTTGYYIDAAGIRLEHTNAEGASASGAASFGVYVGANADDVSIFNTWFEYNHTNLYCASGVKTVVVHGSHFTASPAVAVSTNIPGGIQDDGCIGLSIEGHTNGDPLNTYSGANVKFGLGTSTPSTGFKLDSYEGAAKNVWRLTGGGAGEIQTGLQFDTLATVRGGGIRFLDKQAGSAWCYGNLYNSGSLWGINYDTTAAETGTDCFNPAGSGVSNLLSLSTAGLFTVGNATTTRLSTSYASSTLYYGAGLADCNTDNNLTWTAGRFGCEADDGGAGGLTSYDAWTHPAAGYSATTSILQFPAASSTLFSNIGTAYFGATATSTFDSAGVLTLAAPLATGSGGTGLAGFGGTNTLLFTTTANNLDSSANLTFNPATNHFSTINASTTLLSVLGPAYFGTTATSSFSTTGALTVASGLNPITNNAFALGTAATGEFADLFLAEGGVINWDNADLTLTQSSNDLIISGATELRPGTDGGVALGEGTAAWSNLFLNTGGVLNFENGDVTLTHSAGILTMSADTLDLGASVLEIPNGTGPTADDPGELAHDTTDNQLILDDFVVAKATNRIWGTTVASTSPYMIGGTNLSVPTQLDAYTMTAIRCHTVSGTSVAIIVTDGTNATESITCDSDGASDDGSITNAAVTAGEIMYIDFGTVTGAVDTVSVSVFGQYTRE